MQSYYVILRVSANASLDELKTAYRQRAKECHPDINPGNPNAAEEFKKLSTAYDFLVANHGKPQPRPKASTYTTRPKPSYRPATPPQPITLNITLNPQAYEIIEGTWYSEVHLKGKWDRRADAKIIVTWDNRQFSFVLAAGTKMPHDLRFRNLPLELTIWA